MLVGIVHISIETCLALIPVTKIVIDVILFGCLLEIAIVEVAQQSHVVLRANIVGITAETVGGVYLHTIEEIEDVLFLTAVGIVVVSGETGIPAVHLVFLLSVEAAIGQNSDW